MRFVISLVFVWTVASNAAAQQPVPAGAAPTFGWATASEKDGKVHIAVFELCEITGVRIPTGEIVFVEQRGWRPLTTGTLGDDIRAYRSDGKKASQEDVLKALSKGRGVAYFIGFDKDRAIRPDPFYLGLLNEGSVALAFDRPKLAPKGPVP
jgi:hypothetical protein